MYILQLGYYLSKGVSGKIFPPMFVLAGKGEDPNKFTLTFCIYRIASEDVGLGDPNALGVAVAAMQGCQLIGRPECDVILAQCTVYLARAQKSHEVYGAMTRVKELIKDSTNIPPVPLHLRSTTTSHDLNDVKKFMYMPEELKGKNFF